MRLTSHGVLLDLVHKVSKVSSGIKFSSTYVDGQAS